MSERTPQEVLREAAEQALDRMTTAFDLLSPDMTDEDREKLAQTLWFGKEELDKAIAEAPDGPPEPDCLCGAPAHDPGCAAHGGYRPDHERAAPDTLSEKPGLDVERLIDAWMRHRNEEAGNEHDCLPDHECPGWIVAEYNRLGSTDSEGR